MQQVVLTGADVDLTKLPVHLQHGKDGGSLHFRRHGFRARPRDRLDQCRTAPADAARPCVHRHRSGRAERSAHDLSGDARARRAAAAQRRGRRPPHRLFRRHHAPAGRRARLARLAARRADAGGQEHHQRHQDPRRRRVGAGRLSRRGGISGAGRTLRRIPGLLRRRENQSGLSRDCRHAPPRRAVPDPDHRRRHHEPHRHRAARMPADGGADLARARNRGPRAGCRLRAGRNRRHHERAHRACASASPGRRATPSWPRSARRRMSRTCSWSIPTSTCSPTSRWNGRWPRASSRTAISWSKAVFARCRSIRRWARLPPAPRPATISRRRSAASTRWNPRSRSRRASKARRFESVEAALRDGPKFFENLMAALGSDDGREIVLALEELHRQGRLRRDPAEGRYSLDRMNRDRTRPPHERLPGMTAELWTSSMRKRSQPRPQCSVRRDQRAMALERRGVRRLSGAAGDHRRAVRTGRRQRRSRAHHPAAAQPRRSASL